MGRAAAVRFTGLYIPVIAAFLLVFLRPSRKRIFPAALLGFVWTLPSLLAVQLLNLHFGWWRFNALGGLFRGTPVDLYLGWAVFWEILPILSFDQTGIVWVSGAFFGIDLILMPACSLLSLSAIDGSLANLLRWVLSWFPRSCSRAGLSTILT